MKNSTRSSAKSGSGSWRQIRQNASRKVVTSHARKKLFKAVFRSVLAVALVGGIGVGVYFGVEHWQSVKSVTTVLPAQPLREIRFASDGVLTQRWVESALALPEGIDTMSIDIHDVKNRLESFGQVKAATIRRGADWLEISVRERTPVVKLATRGADGGVVELLVDREGHVYQGFGYNRHEIAGLLFLDGVRLQRQGNGFRRLPGIDQVDDLLRLARSQFPHLVQSWKVVDCRDLPRLRVRSDDIREIAFGENAADYSDQLRWLDMVQESNRRQLMGMQDFVDLSLENQVVVR